MAYKETEAEKEARRMLAEANAQRPGAYQSQYGGDITKTMQQIQNRKPFRYDLGSDGLYQNYKDQYTRAGQMAMADTSAKAASMTGGYGNSFAQTAGQQQYNAYMQGLNDKIPELYQIAMDKWQNEGNELMQRYGMLADADERDWQRYNQDYANWQNERNYAAGRYDTERGFGYQQSRDDVADKQWQTQWDYNTGADAQELAQKQIAYLISEGIDIPDRLKELSGYDDAYIKGMQAEYKRKHPDATGSYGAANGSGRDMTNEEAAALMRETVYKTEATTDQVAETLKNMGVPDDVVNYAKKATKSQGALGLFAKKSQ